CARHKRSYYALSQW
nr:immunoglobulin heavy chain junction region [Macaca mulatta]